MMYDPENKDLNEKNENGELKREEMSFSEQEADISKEENELTETPETEEAFPARAEEMPEAEPMEEKEAEAEEAEEIREEISEEEAAAQMEEERPKYEDDGRPSVREYCYEEQVKKTSKRKKSWSRLIAACLICSIAGGASIGAGYGFTQNYFKSQNTVTATPLPAQRTSFTDGGFSAVDIVSSVKPSVVSISTKITGQAQYFGAFSVPYEASGVGSGVIFYSDDDKVGIVTNNHVVEDANSIYVTFDGDISVLAKVAGTKPESDLAVLTVSWKDLKKEGINRVSVATFGDSDKLQVGDSVIAIGNAMGMGLSATDGIISMTEQTINVDGNALKVLQTSAAINGGNSGGALVNSAGQVIGINTAKYNSAMAEGMGYAIPSNVISPIAEELLTTGTAPKAYIGITGTSITEDNAADYKLPIGALIMEVTEGGPAEKAGIKVGDIITEYDGKTIMSMDTLANLVQETEIGKTVSIHVVRENKGVDMKLTVENKNG